MTLNKVVYLNVYQNIGYTDLPIAQALPYTTIDFRNFPKLLFLDVSADFTMDFFLKLFETSSKTIGQGFDSSNDFKQQKNKLPGNGNYLVIT